MQDKSRKKSIRLPLSDKLPNEFDAEHINTHTNSLQENKTKQQESTEETSISSTQHSVVNESDRASSASVSSDLSATAKPALKKSGKKVTKKAVKKAATKKAVAKKAVVKKATTKKATTKKEISKKSTTANALAKTVSSQTKGMGKKQAARQAFKKSEKRMVSDLHPASLSSSDINQSSQNCVSMTGDKEVEETISKVHSPKANELISIPSSPALKKPSKEKVRELFEKAEKKLTEVFNVKDYPSIVPLPPSHQASVLIEKIKAFHASLAKQDVSDIAPSSYVRRLEKDLHNTVLQAFEDTGDIDQLCEEIYASPRLYIEQKAMFREAVVRLFSINATIARAPSSKPVIVDVFGLPSFGDVASAKKLLANKAKMQQICKMLVSSHAISDKSFSVAVLSIPLRHDALSKPSVLHTLSSVWGAYVAQEDKVDDLTGREILNSVIEKLKPYEVTEGSMGFVFVGVRVWKGSVLGYKETSELLSHWGSSTGEEKTVARTWWQLATGRMLMSLDIEPGSLMIRPPAPPLAAQAQSLSWHITQQIYDRLGMAPFDEINFVTVSENNLALRAYDHRKKLVAQSDSVPLFDVVASAEDFSTLMKEECEATGPRSLMRELSRKE